MVRRRTRALTVLVALTALGGCFLGPDGKYASTAVDLDRAERAWRDPWLGAESAHVPTNMYGVEGVLRTVTERDTSYLLDHVAAARLEIDTAVAHGWSLVGATCTADRTEAVLAMGTGVDDGVRADLVVKDASTDGGSASIASVTGSVAHHADGSWPGPSPTYAVADTCLDGGPARAVDPLPDGRYEGPDAEPDPEDFTGWQRDHLSETESAQREQLVANPWVSSLDVEFDAQDLETGDSSRPANARVGEVTTPARSGRAAVTDLVAGMTDWELTWAACGTRRDTSAGLRLVTDSGVAVALLKSVGDTGLVQWTITPPVPEGPRGDWVRDLPPLTKSRCLGNGPIPGLFVEGVPAVLPSSLNPLRH